MGLGTASVGDPVLVVNDMGPSAARGAGCVGDGEGISSRKGRKARV